MKLRFALLSLCALLAGAAARPAAAENEAYYFPDGLLYVPVVNLQDNNGNTTTNYAAFFRKSSRSWNFKLYGLANAAPQTGVATNFVTSYITNYVTISNIVTITTTNDGTNVTSVSTEISVFTNSIITTNTVAVTNAPPPATANIAGTWDFMLSESFYYSYNGAYFVGATNSPPPFPTNLTLTLFQTGQNVESTSTTSSVQYFLTGEVTNDFFAFTILAGSADSKIALAAGHALIGDDVLIGDYSWGTVNGATIKIGVFTANKQ